MTSAKRERLVALGFPGDQLRIDRFQELGRHDVAEFHRLGDAFHGHGPVALEGDGRGKRRVDRQPILVGLDHDLQRLWIDAQLLLESDKRLGPVCVDENPIAA